MADKISTTRENRAVAALTIAMTNVVKKHSGTEHTNNGFWLVKHLLLGDLNREWWIQELGSEEEYQKQIAVFSRTNEQQQTESKLEEEAKRIREDKLLEAKIEIDKMKALAYSKQTDLSVQKHEETQAEKDALKQVEEDKKRIEEESKIPPPEAFPIIAKLDAVKDLVEITTDKNAMLIIIKAKQFLGSENFQKVARLVRDLGGSYQSAGKDSYFKIPIKKVETAIPQ